MDVWEYRIDLGRVLLLGMMSLCLARACYDYKSSCRFVSACLLDLCCRMELYLVSELLSR